MTLNENLKTPMSAWSRKLTAVMDIHRQRFAQLNPKFKQKPIDNNLNPPKTIYPIILPQTSRPQPRQQARLKQNNSNQIHLPPSTTTISNRRTKTSHIKNPPTSTVNLPNKQYLTLANLTKVFHIIHNRNEINKSSDGSTDITVSTTTSDQQRVHKHLQQTATRWWRPIRSSHSSVRTPSVTEVFDTSTLIAQASQDDNQLPTVLPLITIITNSSGDVKISSKAKNKNFKYDDSDLSTDLQSTTLLKSFISASKHPPQEPIVIQSHRMHIYPYDRRINKNLNLSQQQHHRLIHQT